MNAYGRPDASVEYEYVYGSPDAGVEYEYVYVYVHIALNDQCQMTFRRLVCRCAAPFARR